MNLYRALAIILTVLVAVGPFTNVARAGAGECPPLATFRTLFKIVFPGGRQIVMEGSAAQIYLQEYNNFGRRTAFRGETLFFNILSNGAAMLILIENGRGCRRIMVGPRLHRVIMTKVNKGSRDNRRRT